jgi:hypothetical protein
MGPRVERHFEGPRRSSYGKGAYVLFVFFLMQGLQFKAVIDTVFIRTAVSL